MNMTRKRRISKTLLSLVVASQISIQSEAFTTSSVRSRRSFRYSQLSAASSSIEETHRLSAAKLERKIVQLGRKGRTDEALEIFHSISDPQIRQVNAAIDACSRAKPTRVETAVDLVENSSSPPNVYTFGALMSTLARAGRVKEAQQWLKRMRSDHGVEPNAVVYHAAINACNRAANVDCALDLIEQAEVEKIPLTIVGYNTALSAASKSGNADAALAIFQRLQSETKLPEPDAVTYGTLLRALEASHRWSDLLQYARVMQREGIPIDSLAATSVLHACQQLGLAREALEFLEIAQESHQYRHRTAGRLMAHAQQPMEGADSVAYTLAISACARGGAWQDAVATLSEYIEYHGTATVAAFTAAMTACEYAGEWKEAFLLLERMRKLKVEPNEGTFTAILGSCANACSRYYQHQVLEELDGGTPGAQEKALQLFSVLRKDPSICSPNVQIYNAAIRVCAEAHDVQRAFSLLKLLEADGLRPNVVTFGSIMTACERVHDVNSMSLAFRKMRALELSPNEIIYGAAISACRKAGESERSFRLLQKMLQDGLQPNTATFNTVLVSQVETKQVDRALKVFQLLREKDYVTPTRQSYSILIRALLNSDLPSQAEGLLTRMQADGLIPDVELFTATVAAYERLGQPRKALLLMESMRQEGYDFYESSFLNVAFKQGVKVASQMDQGLRSSKGFSETPIPLPPIVSGDEPDGYFKAL